MVRIDRGIRTGIALQIGSRIAIGIGTIMLTGIGVTGIIVPTGDTGPMTIFSPMTALAATIPTVPIMSLKGILTCAPIGRVLTCMRTRVTRIKATAILTSGISAV